MSTIWSRGLSSRHCGPLLVERDADHDSLATAVSRFCLDAINKHASTCLIAVPHLLATGHDSTEASTREGGLCHYNSFLQVAEVSLSTFLSKARGPLLNPPLLQSSFYFCPLPSPAGMHKSSVALPRRDWGCQRYPPVDSHHGDRPRGLSMRPLRVRCMCPYKASVSSTRLYGSSNCKTSLTVSLTVSGRCSRIHMEVRTITRISVSLYAYSSPEPGHNVIQFHDPSFLAFPRVGHGLSC